MFKLTLRMTLLACTAAWGVAYGADKEEYGYMRLDFIGAKDTSTACFGKDGHHTSGWKFRNAPGFRSCRGYYMLVHDKNYGGKRFKARLFRDGCGSSGLRATFRGNTGAISRVIWGSIDINKGSCGRVEVVNNHY